jgi:hypothetical protein
VVLPRSRVRLALLRRRRGAAASRVRCAPPRAMRNDEDEPAAARDWLAEVQELLLTGGYFRARISALAPFDKARASKHALAHTLTLQP